MMSSLLSTLAATLLAAAPSDQERIQGDWKLVQRVWNHQWSDSKLSPVFTITTFRGNERITDKTDIPDTFVLHPERKPKAIELHSHDETGRPTTRMGVYELEGDTLKLSLLHFGSEALPPPDFACEPRPDRMYWVLKRVRPGDPPEPAPAEVVIADEPRAGQDPTEIKIAVTNGIEEPISVSFHPRWHGTWFQFRIFDERGNPVELVRKKLPHYVSVNPRIARIKPGETAVGYLTPKEDYEIPPGRYQVSVIYVYHVPDKGVKREVESNRITKPFP